MQDTTSKVRHNRSEEDRQRDGKVAREDASVLATLPSRTSLERYGADSPQTEIYRQAVRAILATPELDGRMNYVTASLFVTVFGSWLAGRMLKSRAFLFFVDIGLFLASLAMAGLLIGIMVGENILPAETIPMLLFVATAIVLLIVGFVLGNMLVSVSNYSRTRSAKASSSRGAVVSVSRETRAGWANEQTVHTPRPER